MNKLKLEKQIAVISCLTEGCSIRSTERLTNTHRDTIGRLAMRVGEGCHKLMDEQFRNLDCENIQIDEIWGFVGKKQRHVTSEDDRAVTGDQWIYTAIDADSKIIPSYLIGKRTRANTLRFMDDLKSRLANRVQLSSDGLGHYIEAVETAFGNEVDYAQIVKSYEADPSATGRYSPPKVVKTSQKPIVGSPNPRLVSTSYVERSNLSIRMSTRRLTRLTNAFSKKLDNMKAAVALYFAFYNYVRIHQTLKCTPSMASGLTDTLWSIEDLIKATNDYQ